MQSSILARCCSSQFSGLGLPGLTIDHSIAEELVGLEVLVSIPPAELPQSSGSWARALALN